MMSGVLWKKRFAEEVSSADLSAFPDILPTIVRKLLVERGHAWSDETQKFLYPRLFDLKDPFLLKDMDKAVSRIFEAVSKHEHICIYGDYDVDGVASIAMLRGILQAYGASVEYFIPVRSQEGYGLSKAGIDRCLAERKIKPDLLITVDCGTSSAEEVAYLRELGIDVIILDHHEAGPHTKPEAVALVNPKLEDKSPYTYLCSAGVVFKVAHALLKTRPLDNFDLKQYLDLVAVATVADIVPLVEENRIFVRHGLSRLMNSTNIGLKTLVNVAGVSEPPSAVSVGFRVGPRINAAGRMDSPLDALDLLLTTNAAKAEELAGKLDSLNRKRQDEEEIIRGETIAMLGKDFDPVKDHVIVIGSRSWHPGVVGIVASQLMRRYYKPVFVIAFDESGMGKGSGRSIPGVSLVKAIHECAEHVVSGGGHEMAAGLVIEESQLDNFRKAFNDYVERTTTEEQRRPVLMFDEEVSFEELTLDLLDSYELLEPFGNSNPMPVFMSRNVYLTEPPKRVGTNHAKLFLRQNKIERDAIFFNGANYNLPDPPWDIAFTIDKNVFRGRTSLSISIQSIRSAQDDSVNG